MIDDELRALLEANAAETRRQFEHLEKTLTERVAGTADRLETTLREHVAETADRLETTLREHVAETADRLETTLREHVSETAAETRLHHEILNEGTRHEVRLVAEKVVLVDEKLDREAADIRAEMRDGFAQTQAMLRYFHGDLDHRVTALEDRRAAD